MNTNDLLARWATLPVEQIEAEIRSGENALEIEQLFGPEDTAQVQSLASRPRLPGERPAVVLLPGTMGSYLTSIRGKTALTWINPVVLAQGNARFMAISPDGRRDECFEIENVPLSLEKMSYLKIELALGKHCDLYEFAYDWRKPIEANADLLHECLERWAEGQVTRQFHLVGHSMGGIISRAYLARHPKEAERRVKQIIMHGTPHYGAAAAVENLYSGGSTMDLVQKLNQRNDIKRVIYTMPSLYELLPAPPELFPAGHEYPANWDLYDAKAWSMEGIRQEYLDLGRRFHEMYLAADPQVPQIEIAGCNLSTVVGTERVFDEREQPTLRLLRIEEGSDAGDSTVPLWSALLPQAETYFVSEVVHRKMPDNNTVIEATLDLIDTGTCSLPREIPAKKGGLFTEPVQRPAALEAEELRAKIEAGTASREDLEKLFFVLG